MISGSLCLLIHFQDVSYSVRGQVSFGASWEGLKARGEDLKVNWEGLGSHWEGLLAS